MDARSRIGLEQARASLPALVAQAHAGHASVITRHGKPVAAVVPLDHLRQVRRRGGLLELRGTGAGLWDEGSGASVRELRDEWR